MISPIILASHCSAGVKQTETCAVIAWDENAGLVTKRIAIRAMRSLMAPRDGMPSHKRQGLYLGPLPLSVCLVLDPLSHHLARRKAG